MWPEKTLFTRQEAAQIRGIGVSILDSLISYSDLPRTVIHKHVFIHRKELEKYITKCTVTAPVLLFLRPKGVGKTHLGASIIREAGGTFISIEEMIFQYEGSTDYHAKINRVDLMNFYSTTPMLVIDEIGRSMQQGEGRFYSELRSSPPLRKHASNCFNFKSEKRRFA